MKAGELLGPKIPAVHIILEVVTFSQFGGVSSWVKDVGWFGCGVLFFFLSLPFA